MTCANCAANIERSVRKLPGISEANVNFASEELTVTVDDEKTGAADIAARVEKAGYGVAAAEAELAITGMTCANCAATIERVLNQKVPGVLSASVSFAAEKAAVSYLPSVTGVDQIVSAVEKAGYGAYPLNPPAPLTARKRRAPRRSGTRPGSLPSASYLRLPCLCFPWEEIWGFSEAGPRRRQWTGCFFSWPHRCSSIPAGTIMWAAFEASATRAPIWMSWWPWDRQ